MLTYGFRPWLKNVVVFFTVNPTDFLIRNSGDFTVPSKEKSETRLVSLITSEMLSRCLRQKEDLNLNQVADQRFSLKQWFAAGVRKTGSAHFFKGFPRQNKLFVCVIVFEECGWTGLWCGLVRNKTCPCLFEFESLITPEMLSGDMAAWSVVTDNYAIYLLTEIARMSWHNIDAKWSKWKIVIQICWKCSIRRSSKTFCSGSRVDWSSAGGRERLYCFPLFAYYPLSTTNVRSHSNGSKLRLPWLV